MFNKILSTVSVAAVSAVILIAASVGAKASTYIHHTPQPSAPANLTIGSGIIYIGEDSDTGGLGGLVGSLVPGAFFSHAYDYFVTDAPGAGVKWGADVTYSDPADIGIMDLTLTWDTGATLNITDGAGFDGVASNWSENYFTTGLHTLTISGTLLSAGGAYSSQVSAIPLPPAALLFGTALFGIGALRRRKDKKAMDLAA